jgi:two-component system LytT family response regulator
MMRTVIVDDELSNIENLEALLLKHCPQIKVVGSASNVEDAARQVNLQQPELLFLDIQMHGETGFDLLRLLPAKQLEVVFVTAFDHYGIQAIKFAALDYLLKPVDIDELMAAVSKAEITIKDKRTNQQLDLLLNHLKRDEKQVVKIALPQQKEIRYVSISDIVRCEADNTYTFFYLQNGDRVLISKSLKEYADLLEPNGFLRSHQSHLVNANFVKSWLKEDGGVLLLNDGSKIPISKPNREKLKAALSNLSV